jgi:Protein of unknown function (DUF1364)
MLTRSGFKRPQIERKRTVHTPVPLEHRRHATMARADGAQAPDPKTEAHRNPALLEMARGRPCLIRMPIYFRHDPETVVACHSNLAEHGKAGARKADDEYSVWGCFFCHRTLDQGHMTEAEKRATFAAAHQRQIAQWERIANDPTETARFRRAAQWALNHLIRK